MNELYLLLEHALPNEEETYLLDELDKMIDTMQEGTIAKCLAVMYDPVPQASNMRLFVLFVQGLRENLFFEYAHFVRGLKKDHGRRR